MLVFVPSVDYIKVFAPDRVVGFDQSIGYIMADHFRPTSRMDYSLDELKQLALKVEEFIRFGNNIPECENCGGTPGFPNDDCVWGNHGLLAEN